MFIRHQVADGYPIIAVKDTPFILEGPWLARESPLATLEMLELMQKVRTVMEDRGHRIKHHRDILVVKTVMQRQSKIHSAVLIVGDSDHVTYPSSSLY